MSPFHQATVGKLVLDASLQMLQFLESSIVALPSILDYLPDEFLILETWMDVPEGHGDQVEMHRAVHPPIAVVVLAEGMENRHFPADSLRPGYPADQGTELVERFALVFDGNYTVKDSSQYPMTEGLTTSYPDAFRGSSGLD